MENDISFLFTLLGLEFYEIEGIKVGVFFTPSLRIYYIGFNIMRQIQILNHSTYVHLNSTKNIGANIRCPIKMRHFSVIFGRSIPTTFLNLLL